MSVMCRNVSKCEAMYVRTYGRADLMMTIIYCMIRGIDGCWDVQMHGCAHLM